MKLRDLWSPMSDLTQAQKDVSNSVVGGSLALLGVLMVAAMPLAAHAQRMGGGYEYGGSSGGYSLPGKPVPAPAPAPAPVRPAPAPAPAPAPQPTYQPPAPRPQPQQPAYGTFRAYGPLPEGRVNVTIDGSFEQGQIFGYTVYTQDNGAEGNDQMVIMGPEGKEQVWINCWVTEEWKSYGPNSEEFIHGVVSRYCDWN